MKAELTLTSASASLKSIRRCGKVGRLGPSSDANAACAVHCRYCFRRQYPYEESPRSAADWQNAIDQLATDPAIDEVILLARRFGSANSPSFVNGILDKIAKTKPEMPKPVVEPVAPVELAVPLVP